MVIEEGLRVLVAWEEDPDDWLCEFAKTPEFPARRWADDMARVYNARARAQLRIHPPSTSSV